MTHLKITFITSLIVFLSGCNVIHLHDAGQALRSKEALDTYRSLEVTQAAKLHEGNYQSLEQLYLAEHDKRWSMHRNRGIALVLKNSSSMLHRIAFSSTFGLPEYLNDHGIKDKPEELEVLQQAISAYEAAVNDYQKSLARVKKKHASETKELRKTLQGIYTKNADKVMAEKLPGQLANIKLREMTCLTSSLPSASVPSYLVYNFNPDTSGMTDTALASVGNIKQAYIDFNTNFSTSYQTAAQTGVCKEPVPPTYCLPPAKICDQKVLQALRDLEKYGVKNAKGEFESVLSVGSQAKSLLEKKQSASVYEDAVIIELASLEQLKKDLREYKSVLGITGDPDKKTLNKYLGKLRIHIETAGQIDKLASIEIASEERLNALDAMIQGLLKGEVPDENQPESEQWKENVAIASSLGSLRIRLKESKDVQTSLQLQELETQRDIADAALGLSRTLSGLDKEIITLRQNRLFNVALAAREYKKGLAKLMQFAASSNTVCANDAGPMTNAVAIMSGASVDDLLTGTKNKDCHWFRLRDGFARLGVADELYRKNAEDTRVREDM